MAFFKKCKTKDELTARLAEITKEIQEEHNNKLDEIEAGPEVPLEPDPPESPKAPDEPGETSSEGSEPEPKPKGMTKAEKKAWRRKNKAEKKQAAQQDDE